MADKTGQQVGSYRLVRLLGKGGFAEVYLGQHVRVASKQAAVKILYLFDVDAKKFHDEAEITEQLMHPHIVRLRGRTRIRAKIYHRPLDPLYRPIEPVAVEARSGMSNA
jgi:serine/threonine protein kinase